MGGVEVDHYRGRYASIMYCFEHHRYACETAHARTRMLVFANCVPKRYSFFVYFSGRCSRLISGPSSCQTWTCVSARASNKAACLQKAPHLWHNILGECLPFHLLVSTCTLRVAAFSIESTTWLVSPVVPKRAGRVKHGGSNAASNVHNAPIALNRIASAVATSVSESSSSIRAAIRAPFIRRSRLVRAKRTLQAILGMRLTRNHLQSNQ
jgi:hypothetical protein